MASAASNRSSNPQIRIGIGGWTFAPWRGNFYPDVPTGYTSEALAAWTQGVHAWTSGKRPRDVFVCFINGAKERAPAGALALMAQLGL